MSRTESEDTPPLNAKITTGAMKRVFCGVALFAMAAVGAGAFYGVHVFKRAMPDYSSTVSLPGLKEPVNVLRDSHAIPTIFAQSMMDAVRTLGYVHASERFFQMEMQRRAGQGRLSEAIGKDGLGIDKFVRTLGLYRRAQSSVNAFTPEARAFFQAYADGVNAWIDTHRNQLPPEFAILGTTPEPWGIEDSVVWQKLMALQLSENYKKEMLRAELAATEPAYVTKDLFPNSAEGKPITIAPRTKLALPVKEEKSKGPSVPSAPSNNTPLKSGPQGALPQSTILAAADQLEGIVGLGHGASNEWVISGSRTESGKPILANDPHLGLEAPIVWYLTRIVTPELNIKGGTIPGLPIVLLGQNDYIAWGLTTTGSDVADLFTETLIKDNADAYRVGKDKAAFFDKRREVIHVKNSKDVLLIVRESRHGPVLSDIDPAMAKLAGQGRVMTLAFTALDDADTTAEALMQLNRAKNWDEFKKALYLYHAPPQNMVYADRNGNIGFINPGFVPVRKNGDGRMPADGAMGDHDWRGIVPFTELPQVYNPPAGFVFNANNAVTSKAFSIYNFGSDWEEPFRARRLQQFFDQTKLHTPGTSASMQADRLSLVAVDLLPYIKTLSPKTPAGKSGQDILAGWNGAMDKDAAAPMIFEAWLYTLHHEFFAGKGGPLMAERGPYAADAIEDILHNNSTNWCGASGCAAFASSALDRAMNFLEGRHGANHSKWKWGDEHKTILQHKLYKHIPFLSSRTDLSVPSGGGFYTLDRGEGAEVDPAHPFVRTHGGGYRAVYDLSNPDASRFMIATGQSGHILSRHYGDLVQMWNEMQYVTLSGNYQDRKRAGDSEQTLQPSGTTR